MKKIFKKIHLWLSVPFGLIISIICFTGAMLVFEQEFMQLCYRDRYYVKEVAERPLPIDRLVAQVSATLPDSVTISSVNISPNPKKAYQMGLSQPRRASVYVDQYTGEVKWQYQRAAFFTTMFRAHRWLLDSMKPDGGVFVGKLMVGISTLVFVFVLITGLIIWIPKSRKALKNRLKISVNKGLKRFWYDLHVAGGIYALILLLIMALTGLTWSFSWYRAGFYKVFGVEMQQGGGHGAPGGQSPSGGSSHGERSGQTSAVAEYLQQVDNQAGNEKDAAAAQIRTGNGEGGETRGESRSRTEQRSGSLSTEESGNEWARNERVDGNPGDGHGRGERSEGHPQGRYRGDREGRGESSAREGRGEGQGRGERAYGEGNPGGGRPERAGEGRGNRAPANPYAQWQKVYEQVAAQNPDYKQISLSAAAASVSFSGWGNQRASDRYTYDAPTGEITGVSLYKEQEKAGKMRGWIYTMHVGSWGGYFSRILTFLAALFGTSLPLTGYYLWIKRGINQRRSRKKKATANS
ncbi:MAG: PepSY domain-containing protein [Rikenellaceae bacterium]|nr:PepSY domain-containing protein [Rikenellaceae bacterium]